MKIEFAPSSFERMEVEVLAIMQRVKAPVQKRMGERFYEMVMANFGYAGVDRPGSFGPHGYKPLTVKYARKVGRDVATLVVSGALRDSVQVGGGEGDSIAVSASNSSVPYATAHQYGVPSRNLPARGFFPVEADGTVREYTESQVLEAAKDELQKLL